jgi:hypothetical protein
MNRLCNLTLRWGVTDVRKADFAEELKFTCGIENGTDAPFKTNAHASSMFFFLFLIGRICTIEVVINGFCFVYAQDGSNAGVRHNFSAFSL